MSRKLLRMDVLTSETCWALNNEIIKQLTSIWSLFIQLLFPFTPLKHSKRRRLFTSKFELILRKKLPTSYNLSLVFYGAESWTLREVIRNNWRSFKIWYWGRVKKISWTDRVKIEEVLKTVKEGKNILHTIKRRWLIELVTSCVGSAFWNTL